MSEQKDPFARMADAERWISVSAAQVPNTMARRLYRDSQKTLWVIAKCVHCYEVHKFPVQNAAIDIVQCKTCGRPMDFRSVLPILTEVGS